MKNLLIVDDEEIILEMLVEYFRIKGFNVFSASTEEDAQACFDTHKNEIDAVILDMLLAQNTSDELFNYIHTSKPNIKIIISSGLSEEDFDEDITKYSYQFVKKPYIMEDLLNVISNV